jgi:hypothetical protein
MIVYSVPTGVFVAQSLNQTIFPQFPRLTADFAGMEGFLYGGFDALTNRVSRNGSHGCVPL